MNTVAPVHENQTMDKEPDYYGMSTNTTAVPPVPMAPPPGQALPGQPQPIVWMPAPVALPGCPPGLEYLTHLDQLLVHQQVELLEVFTDWETENKYQIKNSLGQQIYFAFEESDTCMRQCCGAERSFTMHIVDNMNQEVMRILRPFQCCAGCCWFADCCCCPNCALTITIESPPGQTVGHVVQKRSAWKPHYDIVDPYYEPLLKIRGPCCFCQGICCTGDIDFRLMTHDESQEIGKISKQWAGIAKEWFTKADNFGITFPKDLDVKVKACLLGALFLIDFMYFQEEDNGNHN